MKLILRILFSILAVLILCSVFVNRVSYSVYQKLHLLPFENTVAIVGNLTLVLLVAMLLAEGIRIIIKKIRGIK